MKLTILGSGTHIPVKHRSNPAYLLDIEGETVLFDCGSGTLRQIARAGRSEWEIDKIFLSHLHIDHTIDLIPLFFTFKYQHKENELFKVIPVYAHEEFADRLQNLENIYGKWIKSEKRVYRHIGLLPNQQLPGNFKIETFSADHADHSLIFRLTDGQNRRFVYSGDTSLTEDLIRAAYRADLALIECSGWENSGIQGHLSPGDVKKLIFESKIKKIVVTHINPENDTEDLRSKIQAGTTEVIIAKDLMTISLQTRN
ncbi:MAG: MBL fold metallo-hydrolase [Fidelibacterota bacterium]